MAYVTNGKCWVCRGWTTGINGPAPTTCKKCFRARTLLKSWGDNEEGARLIIFFEKDGQEILDWVDMHDQRLRQYPNYGCTETLELLFGKKKQ